MLDVGGVQTSHDLRGEASAAAPTGILSLVRRCRNLVAVPSYHDTTVFAVAVREVFRRAKPGGVAIELAEPWAEELEWGASGWPAPVASYSEAWRRFLPIVPGDSIVEAYRLARSAGVPVAFVDLAVARAVERPEAPCPDPNLAPRQSLLPPRPRRLHARYGPPADADVAREAHMARALARLMEEHESVLWVGGMAPWTRIRRRLETGDFSVVEPDAPPEIGEPRRFRLDATALHRMAGGRCPWLVARWAEQQDRYDEREALRDLALAAAKGEHVPAIEVAAMLTYARNLAAQRDLRETPDLWDLLTAASASLDDRYVGRLLTLALRNRFAGRPTALVGHRHGRADDLPLRERATGGRATVAGRVSNFDASRAAPTRRRPRPAAQEAVRPRAQGAPRREEAVGRAPGRGGRLRGVRPLPARARAGARSGRGTLGTLHA